MDSFWKKDITVPKQRLLSWALSQTVFLNCAVLFIYMYLALLIKGLLAQKKILIIFWTQDFPYAKNMTSDQYFQNKKAALWHNVPDLAMILELVLGFPNFVMCHIGLKQKYAG